MSTVSNTRGSVAEKKLLGVVASKVQTGHLVVRLSEEWKERPPRTGWRVEVEGDGVSGILVDVIGDVESPYGVVKVEDRTRLAKVTEGVNVYVVIPRPKPRRRRMAARSRRVSRRRPGKPRSGVATQRRASRGGARPRGGGSRGGRRSRGGKR